MEGQKASRQARHDLVASYRKYVTHLAGAMLKTMNLSQELFDEMEAAGYLGLVEAADRFDFESGSDFKAFAYLRIRGSIIDAVRGLSDLSGKSYHYAKALQAAQELRDRLRVEGEAARQDPLVQDAEVRLAAIMDFAAKGALAFRLSIVDAEDEVSLAVPDTGSPEEKLNKKEKIKELRELVATLPEKERLIIEQYYFREKSFKQIVDENESMSKSWVSRLHARALEHLKQACAEKAAACG